MQIPSTIATWIDTVIPNIRSRSIMRSVSSNSHSEIAYAQFPEALVRYRVVGDGPQTLILATDPPVVIEQYDELIQILKSDFRVIVFEIPGFGFSMPRSGFSFDFVQLNNLVAKFLSHLDMGPYILAFPCVSAYGAVDIAKRFPGLVKGVVLIQAPSWHEEIKWKHGRDKRQILSKPIIGQLTLQFLKRKYSPQWFEAAVGRKDRLSQFVETTDNAFEHGACFCLASAFQSYLTDTAPSLSAVSQPTLIVWGEADKSHRRTDKSSSKVYSQDASNLHIHSAGHFPELEEPELFSKAVRKWAHIFSA